MTEKKMHQLRATNVNITHTIKNLVMNIGKEIVLRMSSQVSMGHHIMDDHEALNNIEVDTNTLQKEAVTEIDLAIDNIRTGVTEVTQPDIETEVYFLK